MINNQKIVVVTGAESTGKSTLTQQLAKQYKVPFIPELAREYVEKLKRKYTYSDVEDIAKSQVKQLSEFKAKENEIIFLDTWLIITKIWFEAVFKKEPDWLDMEIRKTKIDLFLVCDTDIPWIKDPVRENGGENRIKLQKKYIETIEYFNFDYKIVSGNENNRLKNAITFLQSL